MNFTTNYTEIPRSNQGNDLKYLDAGIHEDCKITNIRIDKTAKGASFIEFTFESQDGRVLKHSKFEPTPIEGQDELAMARRGENFMRNILQIVRCYTQENFQATSFESMANWIKGVIEPQMNNVALRIKVVYRYSEANGRDYSSLPMYFEHTYIEPMSIPKEKSTIKIVAQDKIERTIQGDKEQHVQDAMTQFGAPTQSQPQATYNSMEVPF